MIDAILASSFSIVFIVIKWILIILISLVIIGAVRSIIENKESHFQEEKKERNSSIENNNNKEGSSKNVNDEESFKFNFKKFNKSITQDDSEEDDYDSEEEDEDSSSNNIKSDVRSNRYKSRFNNKRRSYRNGRKGNDDDDDDDSESDENEDNFEDKDNFTTMEKDTNKSVNNRRKLYGRSRTQKQNNGNKKYNSKTLSPVQSALVGLRYGRKSKIDEEERKRKKNVDDKNKKSDVAKNTNQNTFASSGLSNSILGDLSRFRNEHPSLQNIQDALDDDYSINTKDLDGTNNNNNNNNNNIDGDMDDFKLDNIEKNEMGKKNKNDASFTTSRKDFMSNSSNEAINKSNLSSNANNSGKNDRIKETTFKKTKKEKKKSSFFRKTKWKINNSATTTSESINQRKRLVFYGIGGCCCLIIFVVFFFQYAISFLYSNIFDLSSISMPFKDKWNDQIMPSINNIKNIKFAETDFGSYFFTSSSSSSNTDNDGILKEKETLPEAAKKVNLKQDPATTSKTVHSKEEKKKRKLMKRKLKEEKQKKRKQMKKGNNRVDAEEESDNIQIIPKKKKLPVKKENKMKENTKSANTKSTNIFSSATNTFYGVITNKTQAYTFVQETYDSIYLSISSLTYAKVQLGVTESILYVVNHVALIFQRRTILFIFIAFAGLILTMTLFYMGIMYWLKKKSEEKRQLKLKKQKEKALNKLHPVSYHRKASSMSMGNLKQEATKSTSALNLTTRNEVSDSIGSTDQVHIVNNDILDEDLGINNKYPDNNEAANSNTLSLGNALLIVASHLTTTDSLKLMTELILSEVVHGNAWTGEDIERARQHLMTTSMMTSQKQLDEQMRTSMEGNDNQNENTDMEMVEEKDPSNKTLTGSMNDNESSPNNVSNNNNNNNNSSIRANETLHLVFNDLNFLQEKIQKDGIFTDENGTPSNRPNLKNLELSAIYANSANGSPNVVNTPILLQQPMLNLRSIQQQERQLSMASDTTSFNGSNIDPSNELSLKMQDESKDELTNLRDRLTPRNRSLDALAMSPMDPKRWSSSKKSNSRLSIESKLPMGNNNMADNNRQANGSSSNMMQRAALRRNGGLNSRRRLSVGFNSSGDKDEYENNHGTGNFNSGGMGMNISLAFDDGNTLLGERKSSLRRKKRRG